MELSDALHSTRESLLSRSRANLQFLAASAPESPEPYLDMSAGKLQFSGDETDQPHQDYVNAEIQSTNQVAICLLY